MINKLRNNRLLKLFLITVSYILLVLDTVKYPGFVGKHFLIDTKVYVSASIVFIFFQNKKILKSFYNIILLFLIFSGLGYVYFAYLEAANYVNFVLSTYKINLEGLVYIPVFSGLVLLASNEKFRKLIKLKPSFWQITLTLFVVYTLFVNFGKSLNQAIYSDFYVVAHLTDSHDEKMYEQWGDFYDYMVFVINNTSDDVTIIIPPHLAPWWNRSGDINLVKSFLYPRKLVQYQMEKIPDLESQVKGTYVMVAWGEWGCDTEGVCRGWPIQEIKASEFIIKKDNSSEIKEVRENVTYNPADKSNPYGLIKL